MSGRRSSMRLSACLLASVAIHAGATALVAVQHNASGSRGQANPPPPLRKPPVLGDALGSAASIDWIGFESPDRHVAPVSEVNQPALALNAGPLAPPLPPSLPSSATAANPVLPDAQNPPAQPAAGAQLQPVPSPDLTLPRLDQIDLSPLLDQLRAMLSAQSQPAQPAPEQPAEATAQANEAPTRPTPPSPPPGAARDPGAPSDRESAAASREPIADVRLHSGQVLSAAGLEITTRKPHFETLTRLVARPRSPIVRICFDRSGRVANVELTQSSGYDSVDGPVVTAVYNWTARGEPLLKLDDGETMDVVIRILLR